MKTISKRQLIVNVLPYEVFGLSKIELNQLIDELMAGDWYEIATDDWTGLSYFTSTRDGKIAGITFCISKILSKWLYEYDNRMSENTELIVDTPMNVDRYSFILAYIDSILYEMTPDTILALLWHGLIFSVIRTRIEQLYKSRSFKGLIRFTKQHSVKHFAEYPITETCGQLSISRKDRILSYKAFIYYTHLARKLNL